MGYFSENNFTTIVLNATAFLILFGVIYYTSHYRKRGRIDDKLYFAMVLITMLCVLSCGAAYAVETVFYNLTILLNDIYFITLDASFCLTTIYFDYRSHQNKALSKKRVCILSLPAVLTAIALILNHGVHFIFWVDDSTGMFKVLKYYNVIYVAPVLYAIAIIFISRINKGGIFVMILLIVSRIVLAFAMPGVTSTTLFIAVALVFIHINEMRYSFYDEERNASEEKEGV